MVKQPICVVVILFVDVNYPEVFLGSPERGRIVFGKFYVTVGTCSL